MSGRYMIHKAGKGWYRPGARGYSESPAAAGLFDREVAHLHASEAEGIRAVPLADALTAVLDERARLTELLRRCDGLALRLIESAADEARGEEPEPPQPGVASEASVSAQSAGGHARAAKLAPERRAEIARRAAAARWSRRPGAPPVPPDAA